MTDPPSWTRSGVEEELEALRRLARLHGVELRHTDGFDREVRPSPETVVGVLRAMGLPLEGPGDAPTLLRARSAEEGPGLLEPVQVVGTGSGIDVRVHPGELEGAPARLRLYSPEGELQEWNDTVTPRMAVPGSLLPGCYDLELQVSGASYRTSVVAAPPQTYHDPRRRREWGGFLPLHALRRSGDWGFGSLGGLEALLRWVRDRGGEMVGTLPLFPIYVEGPVEPSPYAPVSRLFWNELYLDPRELPEWGDCREVREWAESPPLRERAAGLERASSVDYEEVARCRLPLLDRLAAHWREKGGEDSADYRGFLQRRPEVGAYADFRAAVAAVGPPGPDWAGGSGGGDISGELGSQEVRLRHRYAQYRFSSMLESLVRRMDGEGGGLYLDLPLGAHPQGFDVWAYPELFAQGASLGAPPDGFHGDGQNWGLPPLVPPASRASGHRHFRRILDLLLPPARTLRIDHVMGLHRMYWVPDGFSAAEGAYVRYPHEELWAILSAESHRHGTQLVGEDLGTVPHEVREAMERMGVGRSYVVPFSIRPDHPTGLEPQPSGSVASMNTHDLPPFAAFWKGTDLAEREAAGELDPDERGGEEEWRETSRRALRKAAGVTEDSVPPGDEPMNVLAGVLERLGRGPAGLVLVNLEDLWLEERPQNRPGTAGPDNWTGRARISMEEWAQRPDILETLERLDDARKAEGVV